MSKLFIEKRVSDALKVPPGVGSVTVDIPFVPEFIRVKFLDADHTQAMDTLSYDIAYIGDPECVYQVTIAWEVTSTRRFRYTVAKLASFHPGGV